MQEILLAKIESILRKTIPIRIYVQSNGNALKENSSLTGIQLWLEEKAFNLLISMEKDLNLCGCGFNKSDDRYFFQIFLKKIVPEENKEITDYIFIDVFALSRSVSYGCHNLTHLSKFVNSSYLGRTILATEIYPTSAIQINSVFLQTRKSLAS
jgi:hypothetical protein